MYKAGERHQAILDHTFPKNEILVDYPTSSRGIMPEGRRPGTQKGPWGIPNP